MKTARCLTNSNSTSSFIVLEYKMKSEIHPNYNNLKAKCGCGNEINVGSTRFQDMYLDVCSACHPFYTGKQKMSIPVEELTDLINALVQKKA